MIRLSDNLEINKPAPVDDRLGVFVSTASALSSIAEDRRYVGLTVIVDDGSGAEEYWFKDGVTDSDLEAKSTGGGGAAWFDYGNLKQSNRFAERLGCESTLHGCNC